MLWAAIGSSRFLMLNPSITILFISMFLNSRFLIHNVSVLALSVGISWLSLFTSSFLVKRLGYQNFDTPWHYFVFFSIFLSMLHGLSYIFCFYGINLKFDYMISLSSFLSIMTSVCGIYLLFGSLPSPPSNRLYSEPSMFISYALIYFLSSFFFIFLFSKLSRMF